MSQPYYGGMRHIHTAPGIFDQACGEIRSLNEDETRQVIEFIGRLKAERKPRQREVGTAEAVLSHQGKFSFNEGERERLLAMILEVRQVGIR
ncbi:MAG TPA: hypothetical protein PLZ21_08640 [Armatimonadota bacterium]|jgi:hypothetical protein|nr:hypothetical protein [Armatimonadota bacterium]HOM70829.1 hypothetical protein [Armatimonadota bacterium]HOP80614.1 hypothetical protein [Armatimonadota bacterium]